MNDIPVILPPGRLRLATSPCCTGSLFGRACERVLLVTARPRNLPSITCCAAGDGEAKHICVCPPTAEPTARPALLKGTCTRSRPRERRNVSPTRCPGVPVPGDA